MAEIVSMNEIRIILVIFITGFAWWITTRSLLSSDKSSFFYNLHKDSRTHRMLLFSLFTFSYVMAAAIVILRELNLLETWIQWFLPGSGGAAATVTARKFANDQKILAQNRIISSQREVSDIDDEGDTPNQPKTEDVTVSIPVDADTVLLLDRIDKRDTMTIGKLSTLKSKSINLDLFTVEDKYIVHEDKNNDGKSDNKVWGEHAIPDGLYELVINRHKGKVWSWMSKYPWFEHCIEIKNVPFYDAIFFHIGNDGSDTHGCVCPVKSYNAKMGLKSTEATEEFYRAVYPLLKEGKRVYILIK